jgi:hypothetical protein
MLLRFKQGMDLQRGVEDSDETQQHHEARGEEVHDKFQGIFQKKGTQEPFDAEDQKKKRKKGDQNVFSPPEIQNRPPHPRKVR